METINLNEMTAWRDIKSVTPDAKWISVSTHSWREGLYMLIQVNTSTAQAIAANMANFVELYGDASHKKGWWEG